MGKFAVAAIGFLVVFGVIFGIGFVAGGAAGTGMSQENYETALTQCLPINDVAALTECLSADAAAVTP